MNLHPNFTRNDEKRNIYFLEKTLYCNLKKCYFAPLI